MRIRFINPVEFDLDRVSAAAKGYCGAEIGAVQTTIDSQPGAGYALLNGSDLPLWA